VDVQSASLEAPAPALRHPETKQLVARLDFQELVFQPFNKIAPRSAHARKFGETRVKVFLCQPEQLPGAAAMNVGVLIVDEDEWRGIIYRKSNYFLPDFDWEARNGRVGKGHERMVAFARLR
jgi:hypothetical protein